MVIAVADGCDGNPLQSAGQAHSCLGRQAMSTSSVDWGSKREDLKMKRSLLFKVYLEHASEICMSVEIKKIDDQIEQFRERTEPKKRTER